MINAQNIKSKKTALTTALGNNAKSPANKIILDHETGEQVVFEIKDGQYRHVLSPEQAQSQRFALQNASRALLPYNRVAKCQRLKVKGISEVSVCKTPQGTGVYKGLQTCGSVWDCPVCSAKVGARRAEECKQGLEKWLEMDGKVYFITLTFPHTNEQSAMELREKQRVALNFLKSNGEYKKLKKRLRYQGVIRSLEVTYGKKNGFHPHTHELFLCKNATTFGDIKNVLFPIWRKACHKAGLGIPNQAHGVDVQGGQKAAEYINKFGQELTLSHLKKAKNDRHTPFSMLAAYHYDNDKELGQKFVEYSDAFFCSRQIFWTNGLKDLLGVSDMSDEELATLQDQKATEVTTIDSPRWEAVTYYKQRASVLQVASTQGKLAADKLVEALYDKWIFSDAKMQKDSLKLRDSIRKQNAKESAENSLAKRTDMKGRMAHALYVNDLEFFERARKIKQSTIVHYEKFIQ